MHRGKPLTMPIITSNIMGSGYGAECMYGDSSNMVHDFTSEFMFL